LICSIATSREHDATPTMKARILIVAEDATLRATLARWLLAAGYAVELAESARRAREVIAGENVALAILAPHGMGAAGAELASEVGDRTKRLILILEPASEGAAPAELPVQSGIRISWPASEPDLLARIRQELTGASTIAAPDAPQRLRF